MDVPLCNGVLTKNISSTVDSGRCGKKRAVEHTCPTPKSNGCSRPFRSGRHTIPVFIAAVETGARLKAELLKLKLKRKATNPTSGCCNMRPETSSYSGPDRGR
jgi:hypothetical protein